MSETHNDGMSSDEEVPDVEFSQFRDQLGKIRNYLQAQLIELSL